MEVFLDIQCFKDNYDDLVIKELLTVSYRRDGKIESSHEISNILFQPRYAFDRLLKKYQLINSWFTRNLHGIPWEAGIIPYEKLKKELVKILKNKTRIYVKGYEKKKWLQRKIGCTIPIQDMTVMKCPSIRKLKPPNNDNLCNFKEYHHYVQGNYHSCALENALRLKSWYIDEYYNIKPSQERSVNVYCDLKGNITEMLAEDIAYLRKDFLLQFASYKIEEIWNKLPEIMKEDEEIKKCRRCREHYNIVAQDYDFFDGPIPMIKNCSLCTLING